MGRQVLRGEEKAMTELPRLEAWMGQQVSLYPREGSSRGRTIGLLRNVNERGGYTRRARRDRLLLPLDGNIHDKGGRAGGGTGGGRVGRAAGGTARGAASSGPRRARHRRMGRVVSAGLGLQPRRIPAPNLERLL